MNREKNCSPLKTSRVNLPKLVAKYDKPAMSRLIYCSFNKLVHFAEPLTVERNRSQNENLNSL